MDNKYMYLFPELIKKIDEVDLEDDPSIMSFAKYADQFCDRLADEIIRPNNPDKNVGGEELTNYTATGLSMSNLDFDKVSKIREKLEKISDKFYEIIHPNALTIDEDIMKQYGVTTHTEPKLSSLENGVTLIHDQLNPDFKDSHRSSKKSEEKEVLASNKRKTEFKNREINNNNRKAEAFKSMGFLEHQLAETIKRYNNRTDTTPAFTRQNTTYNTLISFQSTLTNTKAALSKLSPDDTNFNIQFNQIMNIVSKEANAHLQNPKLQTEPHANKFFTWVVGQLSKLGLYKTEAQSTMEAATKLNDSWSPSASQKKKR